jgi:hypothetical protein
MRSQLVSLACLAAMGLAALAPRQASAFVTRGYYYPPAYYGGYYMPNYYAPGPYYYSTGTFGGYQTVAPVASPYYAPAYSAPIAPVYNYTPNAAYYFAPVYSGPRYFQGYAPPRLIVYP